MSEKIKQIAMRIKALREIAGTSIDELAKEFKITKETYKKYESGTIDIPVSFLYEFAGRFQVELTALLTGEEPRLHRYSLVKKGKGLTTERRKEYKYQDIAFNFIGKKSEIFLVTVEPKKKDAVHYNNHPGQEFTYVLEGTLKVVMDGQEVVLDKGDSLYFDSGHNHAMVALKGKPAKFLAVIL
jgi:quercetin dioxygenase-like cupin family protein/DNA-binding XRE family transcriptional regulator